MEQQCKPFQPSIVPSGFDICLVQCILFLSGTGHYMTRMEADNLSSFKQEQEQITPGICHWLSQWRKVVILDLISTK